MGGVKMGKVFLDDRGWRGFDEDIMRQRYHTIFKPVSNGSYVGWVEEIPGTITHGRSLEECRKNLREALLIMVETHRDEARLGLSPNCIQDSIEIDTEELHFAHLSL
jgi:predicted RNase H-like HicB family nuclease